MTPAARLNAVIELLTTLHDTAQPADRLVDGYFRTRRYAGSKDRRWISGHFYDLLRQGARLRWLDSDGDARAHALLGLLLQGQSLAEIAALCDGSGHGPAPLSTGERDRLQVVLENQHDEMVAPDWVRAEIPEWLAPVLAARLGGDWLSECIALNERAPLDLRLNRLHPDAGKARQRLALEGFTIEKARFVTECLRLPEGGGIKNHPLYQKGVLEIQDEGSQLIAMACGAKPGDKVVDFCAGAGGKSLALAAMMKNQGPLQALDIDGRRLRELDKRAQRAGVRNITTNVLSPAGDDPWLLDLIGKQDVVLVDAPCSGSGTWRRNPDAKWRLTRADIDHYVGLQNTILRRAAGLVRPGGILVYAVCSLFAEEGEGPVAALREARPQFIPETPRALGRLLQPDSVGQFLLTPKRHGTDGFFFAVLRRKE